METAAVLAPEQTEHRQVQRFYRPELDVLRVFAFFGVFMFHAAPRALSFYDGMGWPHALGSLAIAVLGSGAYGVDLFFALSAYLISSLLLRERKSTGRVDLRGFYIRRILRIWPLYMSFVALAAVVSAVSHTQHLQPRYVIGYLLLAGNWVYVAWGMPVSFATPLWTISIEEQFYLLWPLLCSKLSSRKIAQFAIGLLVVANLSRITLAWAGASVQAMEFNTLSRLDPIALGTLLALGQHRLPQLKNGTRWLMILSGLAIWFAVSALSGAGMVGHKLNPWSLVLARPCIAFASIVILVAALGSEQTLFKNRTLIYLGKISYGLYVIHEFGRFLAAYSIHVHDGLTDLMQGILALGLTLVLAAVSYRWLETPFLRLKDRFSHVASRPI